MPYAMIAIEFYGTHQNLWLYAYNTMYIYYQQET